MSRGRWDSKISVFSEAGAIQCREQILFDVGKFFADDGIAGDEDQFDGLGELVLVEAEAFAQEAAGAGALDGAADFFGGDDAEFWPGAVGQAVPIGDEAALGEALAVLPHAREIAVLREPRAAVEAQAFRRFGGHARIKRG